VLILVLIYLCLLTTCLDAYPAKKVHTVILSIPELPQIDVRNPDKFLNDLKLSPFWKVEKERDGVFYAKARSLSSRYSFSSADENMFLFEIFLIDNYVIPKTHLIYNHYLNGFNDFSAFSATIIFGSPINSDLTVYEQGASIELDVYEAFDDAIGPNSYSSLALSLSKQHKIYLVLREQGEYRQRKITAVKLPVVMKHVVELLNLPQQYYVKEYYSSFFSTFFPGSAQAMDIRRTPGIQDRDTFYGHFQAHPGVSYEGINIKISHPLYCKGECTRDFNRLDKAEYLGIPYYDNDLLFFQIEDNAVYLQAGYDEQFGTFSGDNSFQGLLEILNDQNNLLYSAEQRFKGWER